MPKRAFPDKTPVGFGLESLPLFTKFSPDLMEEAFKGGPANVDILVETKTNDYSTLAVDIGSLGGRVKYWYQYVPGFAVNIPITSLFRLARDPNVLTIEKDPVLSLSALPAGRIRSGDLEHLAEYAIPLSERFTPVDISLKSASISERDVYVNTVTHGGSRLVKRGISGENSLVAIIDTGIYSDHFMIGRDRIVGGVDLSPDVGTVFEGFDSITNHWHGSAVAGVLGGFAQIEVPEDGLLARSIELNAGINLPSGPDGTKLVTLSGVAPAAKFFIIKVFPHSGAGVPTSVVVRALEIAVEAKSELGLDVDVINMSLGGPTLNDGRGLDARALDLATRAGISVSVSVGNEGPSPMTVGDPGASNPAISSAAIAHPITTRVGWDLIMDELGMGRSLFASDTPQVIYFSSRGPTADGRTKPDVAGIGVFTLAPSPSPFARNGLALVSGTSFASPVTSGVVSLLNDYIEGRVGIDRATPEDFKRSIMSSAIPIPFYDRRELGSGMINAEKALETLKRSTLGSRPLPLTSIAQGTPLKDLSDIRNLFLIEGPRRETRHFTTTVTLDPGHNSEFVFETDIGDPTITVSLTNVQVGKNPNPRAQLEFPNSFEVYVHDPKRGGSGNGIGYYVYSANVFGDANFTLRERSTSYAGAVRVSSGDLTRSVMEPGFYKVVIEGDWTNAVPVSASLDIIATYGIIPKPYTVLSGQVGQFNPKTGTGAVTLGPVDLRFGQVVKLFWSPGDYAHFPSSDVDLFIANALGEIINMQGASLNSPERASSGVESGPFLIFIVGFEINPPGATENWKLQIYKPP